MDTPNWNTIMQLLSYSEDSPIGCFLEVDLDYLDKFHDLHGDYTLALKKNKSSK